MKSTIQSWLNKHPKPTLYVLATFIFVAALLYYLIAPNSSLSANFLAGAVQLGITLLVIDNLIQLDRESQKNRKCKRINRDEAHALATKIAVNVYLTAKDIGFSKELTITQIDGVNPLMLERYFNEFVASDDFKTFKNKLLNQPDIAVSSIKKIYENIEKALEHTKNGLTKIRPYADPDLISKLSDISPTLVAHLRAVELIRGIIAKVSEERPSDKEAIKLINESMWAPLIEGVGPGEELSLEAILHSYFSVLLATYKRALENNLHMEI